MHFSALRTLECIAWGWSASSDCDISDAETGDVETSDEEASESQMAFLRGLDTIYLPYYPAYNHPLPTSTCDYIRVISTYAYIPSILIHQ